MRPICLGALMVLAATACTSPTITVDFAAGYGSYRHDTSGDGGASTGSTDGVYLRLRTEGVGEEAFGGGFSLEAAASDDDLFDDLGVGDTSGSIGDLFIHATAVPLRGERFWLPIRVGPYYRATRIGLDDSPGDEEITWRGLGARVEVEPEFWFLRSDRVSLAIVGDASFGYHGTSIDVDSDSLGISDDFDGDGKSVGASLGMLALFGKHFSMRLGYAYRATHESESDDNNGISVRSMDASFSGVVLQLGVRF